jgi:hypothetical protein
LSAGVGTATRRKAAFVDVCATVAQLQWLLETARRGKAPPLILTQLPDAEVAAPLVVLRLRDRRDSVS